MKTSLRLGITLILAFLLNSFGFAQSVTTTLGSLTDVKTGITRDFTVSMQGNGQYVKGRFTFSPFVANDILLQYKAQQSQDFTNLPIGSDGTVTFGPDAGYLLSSTPTNVEFKILFNAGKNFNYTLDLLTVGSSPQTVATANGTVNVTALQESTIDGTLDNISQDTGLESNKIIEWQIFVNANDRAGEKGNIQMVLANPAQRDKITLEYNANRAAQTAEEVNWQTLTFNDQGIASIGPEGGETLTANQIQQLMRIRFSEGGTFAYTLRFLRDDNNTIASVQETVNVATVASIDDMIGNTRISVYPTVASGTVKVELGEVRNAKVAVTDMIGRVVMEFDKVNGAVLINTTKLAKGSYFIKVSQGKDVAGGRFIVR